MSAAILFQDIDSLLIPGHPNGAQNSVFKLPAIETDEASFAGVGDVTYDQFDIFNEAVGALVMPTFFDDWYHRIHVLPQRFDLANVVSDQNREVLVWNAYLTSKTINSSAFPTGVGVDVIDPVGSPYVMGPLEPVYYNVVVSADGPPTIDALMEWVIDGEGYSVAVTGRRIVVWPFGPNWSRGIVESLDWLTDVMTSFTGDEQRFELRSKPRRMFEYTSVVQKADAALMRNLLWGWQNRNFALPLWMDRTTLQSPVTSGSTLVAVETEHRGFFAGGLLVLFNSALDHEVVEIEAVGTGLVTLAKSLERSWPAGTRVYPINIARMPINVTSRRLTDGVEEANLSFSADPVQTDPYIPAVAATNTHEGYEVVLRKPNWAQPIGIDNQYEYESVDFGIGGVLNEATREFPQIIRKFQWLLRSADDITEFRGLLGRLRGRFKAVYLPTWFDDFELYSDIDAASVTLEVKNNEFLKMAGSDPTLNTLMILVRGQAPIIRTIVNVGSDPAGFTTLGLNAAVGFELTSQTLQRLSLVHLCRLASDRVTINWLSDSKATVEANFALVRA